MWAFVSLAGCAGSGAPDEHFYRLEVPAVAAANAAAKKRPILDGTLVVQRFVADALLSQRPLVFAEGESPRDLKQYNYHLWADPPPRLIQELTADTLRQAGIAPMVVTPELRADAQFELIGKIKRLEHLRGEPGSVKAEIEFGLYRLDSGRLEWVEYLYEERKLTGPGIAHAVNALGEALAAIYGRLIVAMGKE